MIDGIKGLKGVYDIQEQRSIFSIFSTRRFHLMQLALDNIQSYRIFQESIPLLFFFPKNKEFSFHIIHLQYIYHIRYDG